MSTAMIRSKGRPSRLAGAARLTAASGIAALLLASPADARVDVLRQDSAGVDVAWTPEPGGGVEVVRLALPPGRSARLPDSSPLGPAARLSAEGYFRRLRFVDLLLDAGAAPEGGAGERRLRVAFVAAALQPQLPPAVRPDPWVSDPIAPPQSGGAAAGARPAAGIPAESTVGREQALLPLAGFANAAFAADALRQSLADPAAWPVSRSPERGELRRVQRLGQSASGPGSPGDLPGRRRLMGFGTGRVKIVVGPEDGSGRGGEGIYRITGARLAALGVDLAGLRADELRLVTHGFRPTSAIPDEVAIHVEDGGDGVFDASDWFEFWGEPLVGEAVPSGFQGLDYTDVNAYMLDSAAGPRLRMATRDAAPVSGLSPDYLETIRLEENDIFVGNPRTGEYDVDHYYWCGTPLQWQTGDAPAERREIVPAESLRVTSSRTATLRVRLLARTSGSHASEVLLGGAVVSARGGSGYIVDDHVAAGLVAGTLAESNEVVIRLPGGASSPDRFDLDWIELEYPRAFIARSGRLDFRHEPGASVWVVGLPASTPTALDVTDHLRPTWLTGATPAGASWALELGGAADGRYAIAGPGAPEPTAVEWIPDAGLSDPALAIDVVVFGPRAWLDPPLPAVARWIADRESQGLVVLPAPIEDVIDEFNGGVFSPVAPAWMLVEAFATWLRPPAHVLFLGDATFDWKDNLDGRVLQSTGIPPCTDMADPCGFNELAWCQHVPTRMFDVPDDTQFLGYLSSDSILSLVSGGDWMPDVALGRIPARTAAEAEAALDKILAYEQLAAVPPPWATRVALCSDQITRPGEDVLELSQEEARVEFIEPHYQVTTYYYQSDYLDLGLRETNFHADLVGRDWTSTAAGSAVVSYVGHGNSFRWSDDSLLANRYGLPPGCRNDVDTLDAAHVAGGPVPVVLNANCITGSFVAQLGPGLLEELVREPRGGAIAAIGPTGITDISHARTIVDAFFSRVHGPDGRGLRLGEIYLGLQEELSAIALTDPTELLTNVLLGDPTLKLVIPFGPAAGLLRATGGDSRVDLDWDPVPGASTFDVWRATTATGPWTRIASGVTGQALADVAAPPGRVDPQNGLRYWYAIEPFDANGHPGRWSNRADARPCTMDPPAPPAWLNIAAGYCSSSMTVTWGASATQNLQGYRLRVYRGSSAAGSPERTLQTAGTFAALSGLVPVYQYTLTVTALTWCDVESVPLERQITTCPLVMDPPAFVPDLRVARSGSDLLLAWSPVTTTVQGNPLAPALYRVYRADRPDFFADASRELPAVTIPGTVDAGRVGTGASLEFYCVAAEDAAGERGAVGHDFPQGVPVVYQVQVGSDWELTWAPVRYDIRGEFTPVAGYLVYTRADRPFADRGDIAGITPRWVTAQPVRIPVAEGDWHLAVPEDVHGNRSLY